MFGLRTFAQMSCNAGSDFTFCPQSTYQLGGNPVVTGGVFPYTYSWSPPSGLNDDTIPQPILSSYQSPYYVLMVKDKTGNVCTDTVHVIKSDIDNYSAGPDILVCKGTFSNVTLGDTNNAHCASCVFSWAPSLYLNNPNTANPLASIDTTASSVTYTLTINDGTCSISDVLQLIIAPLPLHVRPQDTTIQQGEVVPIRIQGGNGNYTFKPPYGITIPYGQSQNADATPSSTIIYTITSVLSNGCINSNTLIIHVNPSSELIFYNTFTPNGDGINDVFYIANLEQYPDNTITIFNRYGQKIYFKRSYKNDWDGTINGEQVPTGTYFYVLDTGTSKGSYKGNVNIIR